MQRLNTFLCILLFSSLSIAKPIRVLMIDAGTPKISWGLYQSKGRDVSIHSVNTHDHATAMFKLIVSGNCNDFSCLKPTCNNLTVDWCGFMGRDAKAMAVNYYYYCFIKAITGEYDIVNLSIAGDVRDESEEYLVKLLAKKSIVVIAAGNTSRSLRQYPARYVTSKKGPMFAISALDKHGNRLPSSNKDKITIDFLGVSSYYQDDEWSVMEGTSVATALYTHKLIMEKCNVKD